MKILFTLVLAAFAGFAFTNLAEPVSLNLNSASKIDWVGTKKGGFHQGNIKLKSGDVQVQNGKLKGGKFTIDVSSIVATDFEDPKNNGLIKHVLGADFLETEKFPEATFEITKVDYTADNKATLTGNLTLKGITLPIMFPATIHSADDKRFFGVGSIVLDRTLFGVNYDPAKVSKEVDLKIYILATATPS